MRLVLAVIQMQAAAQRALPAPDKGVLRVSYKSQIVPRVPPLISQKQRQNV